MGGTDPSDPAGGPGGELDGTEPSAPAGTERSMPAGAERSAPAGVERSAPIGTERDAHPGSGSDSGLRTPPARVAGSVTMDPLIGRVIAGRYEILQRIGSGGMGSVYRARQASVSQQVALKVLRQDLINNDHIRQRFHREAEIIARLRHPNTIRLIDFCTTDDGLAVMVMELLEGQPLSERLKTGGPLEMVDCLQVGIEVGRSLSEAHLKGLVHRDLKPANIFLNDVGGQKITKVLDFGIARLMDEEATRLTVTDQVFGTPRYMSPEQGMSTANVDSRSDIYSLGLILYECAVGQPPFVAQTSFQYLSAHSAQPPPKLREALPSAPEALEQLIDHCLEKQPDHRPQTAQEVADHLAAIRRSIEGGGAAPAPLQRSARVPTAPTVGGDVQATARPTHVPGAPDGPPSVWAQAWVWVTVLLIAALVGLGTALVLRETALVGQVIDAGAPSSSADAGEMVALIPQQKLEPDAGLNPEVMVEDSGVKPDSGKKRRRRRRRRRPPPPPPNDHALVGPGTIEGPRALVIPTEDTKDDLLRLALDCKRSIFAGLSSITTKGCPADCAILVDATCAGRTPADGRAIPPGRREVAVVCKGKVLRTATVRFIANDATEFRCR